MATMKELADKSGIGEPEGLEIDTVALKRSTVDDVDSFFNAAIEKAENNAHKAAYAINRDFSKALHTAWNEFIAAERKNGELDQKKGDDFIVQMSAGAASALACFITSVSEPGFASMGGLRFMETFGFAFAECLKQAGAAAVDHEASGHG